MISQNSSSITRSDDYVEYCRETAAHAHDLHDLALRGRDKKAITRLIHQHIVEAVELRSDDDLVDIGCGDGTLLRMAANCAVHSVIGLLATEAYRARRSAGIDRSAALGRRERVGGGVQQRSSDRASRVDPRKSSRNFSHRQTGSPDFYRRNSVCGAGRSDASI